MKTMSLSVLTRLFLAFSIMLTAHCASTARQQKDTVTAVNNNGYPLILDFYSIGSGVPDDQLLKDYITSYRKKNKLPQINATLVPGLGREGEYAIVFPLKELSSKQKTQFVAALKKALPTLKKKEENGGIHLTENKPYDINRGRTGPQAIQF